MKPILRLVLLALIAMAMLSNCRSVRKHSPWEVYRSANI